MTLTTRRSSRGVPSTDASGAAHARQNRAMAGFSWPQVPQIFIC
jgi:hypothetical protein